MISNNAFADQDTFLLYVRQDPMGPVPIKVAIGSGDYTNLL